MSASNDDTEVFGIIKFFKPEKHFGFITGDDEKDYFVHIDDCFQLDLLSGDRVCFKIYHDPKGLRALHVRKITS